MNLIFYTLFMVTLISQALGQDLDQLDNLLSYLEKQGKMARVGFLSGSNYLSVKRILPKNTVPVIIEHEEDLTKMVLNGSLVAALVTGLPDSHLHDSLHIFSSEVVTLQTVLMAPDVSLDYPHGVTGDNSTYDLSLAINAAIARVQFKGIDFELAKKNAPKEIVKAHTCKEDDQSQFAVPNRIDAKGFLKNILDKKEIRVLANGPFNWGANDGNYIVDPPIGFYPDLLEAIVEEFKNLSGPDNQAYGDVKIKRVFTKASPFPWYYLFDGTTHISEPYFILDSPYTGSGKSCSTNNDCLNANLPGGKEICNTKWCSHPARPKYFMLRSSCTTLGTDSKFFTKRTKSNGDDSGTGKSKTALIVSVVLLALIAVGSMAFIVFLVLRETRGNPLFVRL